MKDEGRKGTKLLPLVLSVLLWGATLVAAAQAPQPALGAAGGEDVTFFVIGDPQINIPLWGTAGTEQTIDIMNTLPGQPFPPGGVVEEPRGLVILGDLQDDIKNLDNWALYKQLFDIEGRGRLRFKVFEGLGNHDLSTSQTFGSFNPLQREFIARNGRRAGDFHYDSNHYHYSWDWGPLHLVQLNVFPSTEARPVYDRPAPWNDPKLGLDFLKEDLASRVGASGRPVILLWHYGLRGWGLEKWWTPEDLAALREAIAPYNVVLILHGHEHAYAHYQWEGHEVFMAPSPQIDRDPKTPEAPSKPKGFLVIRLRGTQLDVVHHTAEGWKETWSETIELGRPRQMPAPPLEAGAKR